VRVLATITASLIFCSEVGAGDFCSI